MSFQQGLSGLSAAAKSLDVIGNNVANANTSGFKASQAQFADVFASSLTGGSSIQTGIGTKLVAIAQQFTQGSVSVSTNPLDLAINGQGFFRMSGAGAVTYTRSGQFHIDKDGYIVNAENLRLTGFAADEAGVLDKGNPADLRISSQSIAPQATATAKALVNLDSRKPALPAAAFDMNNPATYTDSTSLAVYDSLGNAHTFTMYFVKAAANTWDVFASNNGAQLGAGALGTLNFKSDGTLDLATTAQPFNVAVPVGSGATSPLAFGLDFRGSTQFGGSFGVSALDQDGYAAGRLAGFSIGPDGAIMTRYSNGKSRVQGQIVLANFTNPLGLRPSGSTTWTETSQSGVALVGLPDTGALGSLQSSAVEDSNVDLTSEMVNMITAQRFYQANAQTIKAQDAVLQTLLNLR